jgi:sterol desaturase/sphingolipid hydroxylase (fatty acid hydroxylase superfamily)
MLDPRALWPMLANDWLWPALGFGALALLVGGASALRKARAASGEVRTNIALYALDILVTAPLIALTVGVLGAALQRAGVSAPHPDWNALPFWLVGLLAVFFGDFVGYWRHRLEHMAVLWPAHAVHHSDTRMTWTTLFRFHPINRFSTALIDTGVLALFGFPPWALVVNNLVRHYYGMFIHVDVPWTFGPLGRVLVSPSMHRWHHVRDGQGAGANFATVFSVFDQAFRTHHNPGPCAVPLGVPDEMGRSVLGQIWHPFKIAWRTLLRHSGRTAGAIRNPGVTS